MQELLEAELSRFLSLSDNNIVNWAVATEAIGKL